MSIEHMVPEESQDAASEAEQIVPSSAEATGLDETGTAKASKPVHPQEAALAEMGSIKMYNPGDLVEGTIVQVTPDSLIVDIGTKTEGIITRDEISIGPNPDMSGFAVGDRIHTVVVKEDDEGQYQLSKRRADQRLVWEIVDKSYKDGSRIEATGFRAVKGGLLVDIGTIAFLPQSLVDIRRIDDLEPLVGQKFEVKVVDYDREAKPHPKIVVSRRAILEADLTRERDELYESVEVGSVVDGTVVKLTPYGAFIDVGGLQGLLHISEMSLNRIEHPSDVMQEGDVIKVKVLKIDKKRKRISLGRRELLPNPWDVINQKYRAGMVVQGTISRTADFGAFIRLDEIFEGLAHVSELVDNKISHAKEVFKEGDSVNVLIMNIDKKARRIKLSVRRAVDAQRKKEVAEFMKSQGDLQNVFATQLQDALASSDIDLISENESKEEQPVSALEDAPDGGIEKAEEENSQMTEETEAAPETTLEPETPSEDAIAGGGEVGVEMDGTPIE